jgi:hypothetical protein
MIFLLIYFALAGIAIVIASGHGVLTPLQLLVILFWPIVMLTALCQLLVKWVKFIVKMWNGSTID